MLSPSSSFFFSIVLLSCHLLPATGDGNALESVPDLEKVMYVTVKGFPCVRLLNVSGEIGCSNPGRVKVFAPIVRYKSTDESLMKQSTILVSANEMNDLFNRISKDELFAKNVAGVLVESGTGYDLNSHGLSPAKTFPLAEFAPYHNSNYKWNPIGSGIMLDRYNFPVFLLSKNSTLIVQEIANKNEKSKNTHVMSVAEFDLVMQTTKHGTHNSGTCLEKQTCLPLGGYRHLIKSDQSNFFVIDKTISQIFPDNSPLVWSSLPPINITSSKSPKPLILAIASMDSASFFRDRSFGADSPLSGMISLLAAVDALSHIADLHELKKQLVFLVFTGEAWGYLGSRRFLAELDMGTDVVNGLKSTMIEKVLEIGSVGKASIEGGNTTFFVHAEKDSSPVKDIFSAMERATHSLQSTSMGIKMANIANPGVPPSSMMSFLRKNSSTSGIVLEEFDTAFTNSYYDSHLDNSSNIKSSSIVAAANLVARTLYILARDDLGPNVSVLNSINVNASLVEELVGCLLSCEPGLSCHLVKKYISPSTTCPNHYVGVFLDVPSNTNYPDYVDDTSHFVWNFLADRTSVPSESSSSICSGECSIAGEICIGRGGSAESKGRCVVSSTRYVPAYSTRLKFEEAQWRVLRGNSSDPLGLVDPIWTESYWDRIGLRVYEVQSSTFDHFVVVGGVFITVLSYAAVILTRAFFVKVVKHD